MSIQRGKVVVVERGERRVRAGQGLLKGLGVVWKHWAGSFKRPEKISDTSGTFTVEYPEEKRKLPEAYRNMPILLYDDANGQELCTSCFQCQRICPPQVIHMTQAKDPTTGKAVPAVAEFLIEYDACMSCGFCAEVCPFDAIKMDHEYELSTAEHPKLTVNKEGLNRPISYYQGIAPGMWDEVKESAYKKLQGNMKRRSGLIGVAPQMVERVRALQKTEDRRPETGASLQAAASSLQSAASSTAPAPTAPVAPPAPAAKAVTAEEKAAKLAAIRAANAAKATGDSSQPAVGSSQAAPVAPLAPADD
nr:4Fe-4S dicluster domain-containing protein [Chloroflexaceae bacterium]